MVKFKLWVAVVAVAVVMSTAGVTLAQYGLYGSPDVLQLPTPVRSTHVNNVGQLQHLPTVSPAAYAVAPAKPIPTIRPAARAQSPSVVERMLAESEQRMVPACNCNNQFDQALCEPCASDCAPCIESCCPWYASAAALFMTRNQPNRLWTTYETGNNPNQLMNTNIEIEWKAGGEIRFGRWFCCGTWALEAGYWTLSPFEATSSMSIAGGTVSTPLDIDNINFDGVNAIDLFDSAAEHRLWRRNEIHSVEINVVQKLTNRYCDSNPFDVNLLVGVRYFRFEERLIFGSVDDGHTWGSDGGIHEAYMNDSVENNLFGFQIGVNSKYCLWKNLSLSMTPKIGIFNNSVEHNFSVYRGDGTVGTCTAGTGDYPVSSNKNVFSMLAEVDLGLNWQISQNWGAMLGYRVVAVSGIALSDNQIPHYVVDIPEIADTNTNADLILHGAYAGVTFNF